MILSKSGGDVIIISTEKILYSKTTSVNSYSYGEADDVCMAAEYHFII